MIMIIISTAIVIIIIIIIILSIIIIIISLLFFFFLSLFLHQLYSYTAMMSILRAPRLGKNGEKPIN